MFLVTGIMGNEFRDRKTTFFIAPCCFLCHSAIPAANDIAVTQKMMSPGQSAQLNNFLVNFCGLCFLVRVHCFLVSVRPVAHYTHVVGAILTIMLGHMEPKLHQKMSLAY